MAKVSPVSIKYMIHANMIADGTLEKPDVIGALFGQTEGLLGADLEMRDLQKEGKIGRIEVSLEKKDRKTFGKITIPTALDQSETTLIAAAIETIERVGPSDAQIEVEKIEDVRGSKRDYILERAKKLMSQIQGSTDSREISNEIKDSSKMSEIKEYGKNKLASGDLSGKEIIVVEGRADVVNLVRFGINNVICMNGTKLPEEIRELSKEKETLFTYGDEVDNYIIDRSDFCYTKINYFEKYEFSNNIAFELAKRSMYFYPEMEQTYLFRKIVLKFCSNEYQADLDTNLYQVAYCKYAMLDYDNFSELLYFFKNEKTTMDTIYRDFNCYFRTMRTFKTEEDFYLHTLQFSDVHNADWLKIKRVDEIRANFRAPILPESEFFTVDCRINMSLPEDELIDYIRTTKKGLIKLNKLKSINILELMFGAKHNYTSQISDLLFTYDAIRLGIKFPQVLKSIASYNRTIQSDIYTKDIRTLKKYFKYAKILIEEGYYRGIISSIYIGNLEEKIKNIDK